MIPPWAMKSIRSHRPCHFHDDDGRPSVACRASVGRHVATSPRRSLTFSSFESISPEAVRVEEVEGLGDRLPREGSDTKKRKRSATDGESAPVHLCHLCHLFSPKDPPSKEDEGPKLGFLLLISSNDFLFLLVRHLLLEAMHLFLVASCFY